MTISKAASATFRAKVLACMDALTEEFSITAEDAAAIMGNAGHESGGLKKLQEIKPTVAGSRGGYGWFQWTGPRRRAFEAYCTKNQLKPSSDKANLGFLIYELLTSEKRAIPAVKAARGLEAKVKAFEMAFERAGVKHYPQRIEWAKLALEAWQDRAPAGMPMALLSATPEQPSKALLITYQQRLKDLGFYGMKVDGKWGVGTSAANAAFRHENELPAGNQFDPEMVALLMSDEAKAKTVSDERANATASDIRADSQIVRKAERGETAAAVQAAVPAVGGLAWYSSQAVEWLRPVKEFLEDVPIGVWVAGVVSIAAYLWWQSRKIKDARVEMHRNAEVG